MARRQGGGRRQRQTQQPYDNALKALMEDHAAEIIPEFVPDTVVVIEQSNEIRRENIRADLVYLVQHKGELHVLHMELQTDRDSDMAARMLRYHYATLVDDEQLRQRLMCIILEEYERTCRLLLEIVESEALLDNAPVLQRSIRLRNPYVDPLSHFQVALLRRLRALGGPLVLDEAARAAASEEERTRAQLTYAVLLTINGIAAGLRNTG